MLDLNHVLATPGLDSQYFQGPGWVTSPTAITISSMAPAGALFLASGNYQVGQAIQITGNYLPGTITGYTSGAIYYILTVNGSTIQISASPGGALVTSSFTNITDVTVATGGVLTVSAGDWKVGQPITITGTFTAGSITGYVSGTTYYIITVTSTTSITISATLGGSAVTSTAGTATPGATFTVVGDATVSVLIPQWQTWRKPRGIKWIYMLGVGGGASGGCGVNTATTSGGGAGGGGGGQTTLMIPAMFVPDILYIAAGNGGPAQNTSGAVGLGGTPTYISIEPNTGMDLNKNLFWANPGTITGSAATATTGGGTGVLATAATIGYMPLAGRGLYNLQTAAAGPGAGGSPNAVGGDISNAPNTGNVSFPGSGGGGTSGAGGGIGQSGLILGQDFYPLLSTGAAAASGSTPAVDGQGGFIANHFIFNGGGCGGGGATTTAGGISGRGGNGTPGSGGGGSGGATTTNPNVQSGAGGPGFVLILSW